MQRQIEALEKRKRERLTMERRKGRQEYFRLTLKWGHPEKRVESEVEGGNDNEDQVEK